MPGKGPAPTPTEILRLRGSWLVRNRKDEPKPPPLHCPKPPSYLDAPARKVWRELVPELCACGILTRIDAKPLARYCCLWSEWLECWAWKRKHGSMWMKTVTDKDGRQKLKAVRRWPQDRKLYEVQLALLRMEQEYGLTPSARTRIRAQVESMPHPRELTEDDPDYFFTA